MQPRVTEGGAHCGPCKTCTCGVDRLPVPELQSGAFAARPTTHDTRERPVLGDECRTSLPRVSSGSRTRTYNLEINSRLRCLLRHAGMMKTLCSYRSVRPAGIEPAPSAWKAEVLPLNYTRRGVGNMVVGEGFEPSKLSRQSYSLLGLTAPQPHQ